MAANIAISRKNTYEVITSITCTANSGLCNTGISIPMRGVRPAITPTNRVIAATSTSAPFTHLLALSKAQAKANVPIKSIISGPLESGTWLPIHQSKAKMNTK